MVSQVTCFAEAGGQHVNGMAKAVELLGIRACLTKSTMDSGDGLPANWKASSTDYCIQVIQIIFLLIFWHNLILSLIEYIIINFYE